MSDRIEPLLLSWEQVAAAIFQYHGIDKGLYHVGVSLRMSGVTQHQIGSPPGESLPTAIVGMVAIGIQPAKAPGPMVFDAGKLAQRSQETDASTKRRRNPIVLSEGEKAALAGVVARVEQSGKKRVAPGSVNLINILRTGKKPAVVQRVVPKKAGGGKKA